MNDVIDLLVLGRMGVDLYPQQAGPLAQATTFSRALGGSAGNVAVAAARLGLSTALVSRVGDDPFGRYLRDALASFEVDATWVWTDPTFATPITFAELDPPEDPGLVFYRSPSAPDLQLSLEQLAEAPVETAHLLWTTGTGLSEEPSRTATVSAMRRRTPEQLTVLDLDWRERFWPDEADAARAYREALAHVSVTVGNREEVRIATGEVEPERAAAALHEHGVRIAIVKLGADGVYASDGSTSFIVEPYPVDVVCGLGAGDAFGGMLCRGLAAGWTLERTLRAANVAGAIVASRLLCSEAMPTMDEVLERLEPVHVD